MNEGKQMLDVVNLLKGTFNLIGLISKSNYNHGSEKLTNSLIYASNHLPHQLLAIKEKFQELITQGSKEKVLKEIATLADTLSDLDLKGKMLNIINNKNEDNIDAKFKVLVDLCNDYINSKLYEVTQEDCFRRAKKIKEIQTKIINQASQDVEKILEQTQKENHSFYERLQQVMQVPTHTRKEVPIGPNINLISSNIESVLNDFVFDKIRSFDEKYKILQDKLEVRKYYKDEEGNKHETLNELQSELQKEKAFLKQKYEELDKAKLDLARSKKQGEIRGESDLYTIKTEINLALSKINSLEQELTEHNRDVLVITQRQQFLNNLKKQAEDLPRKDYKKENINELIEKMKEFSFYEKIVSPEFEKSFDLLNDNLSKVIDYATFFKLKDHKKNLENIDLIIKEGVSNQNENVPPVDDLIALRENIVTHSAFQYFNTMQTIYLEKMEETARLDMQNAENAARLNMQNEAFSAEKEYLEKMESDARDGIYGKEDSERLDMLLKKNRIELEEKLESSVKKENAARTIQKAYRKKMAKRTIQKDEMSLEEAASIIAKSLQQHWLNERRVKCLQAYLDYKRAILQATTAEEIDNATKYIEVETINLGDTDTTAKQLLDLRELPFFNVNEEQFAKMFSFDDIQDSLPFVNVSDEELLEMFGDKAQHFKLELENSQLLAIEIIEIVKEVESIEPDKVSNYKLKQHLITLTNDLPHKLNGTTEGNKRFF